MHDFQLDVLQSIIGQRFSQPQLLRQACTHSSYLHESGEPTLDSNERLEFLGDAWLGYVVAWDLFQRYPTEPEGALTKLRAALVQRDTLAQVVLELGLDRFLVLGRGEEQTGGRTRSSNLSSFYEALVGALLESEGEAAARGFILRTLQRSLAEAAAGTLGMDYKSMLQELCQARHWSPPVYHVLSEAGPPHAKRFEVEVQVEDEPLGRGVGSSRRRAEKAAAQEALAALAQRQPSVPAQRFD